MSDTKLIMTDTSLIATQAQQTLGGVLLNPTLPARRTDIREMTQEEWRKYRDGIKRILCSAAESDEVRRTALEMIFEADRRLWVNGLANRKYWKESV